MSNTLNLIYKAAAIENKDQITIKFKHGVRFKKELGFWLLIVEYLLERGDQEQQPAREEPLPLRATRRATRRVKNPPP